MLTVSKPQPGGVPVHPHMGDDVGSALHARGWSISAIARHLERDRKTMRAYVRGERTPGSAAWRLTSSVARGLLRRSANRAAGRRPLEGYHRRMKHGGWRGSAPRWLNAYLWAD